jgi:hypothetical protein
MLSVVISSVLSSDIAEISKEAIGPFIGLIVLFKTGKLAARTRPNGGESVQNGGTLADGLIRLETRLEGLAHITDKIEKRQEKNSSVQASTLARLDLLEKSLTKIVEDAQKK